MDEETAIDLAKQGNENGFMYLYKKYWDKIYQLAYRYVLSAEDAKDIMQETFISAFKGVRKYKNHDDSSFVSWLNRICINCSINYIKKNKKDKKFSQILYIKSLDQLAVQNPNIVDMVQLEQELLLIKKSTLHLSIKQKIIFDLRFIQHHNIKNIANMMNCSESNIKTQLGRSIAKLKKIVLPQGGFNGL
jgi:RNA polymerase sigma-70 factor (ECF subfamily)